MSEKVDEEFYKNAAKDIVDLIIKNVKPKEEHEDHDLVIMIEEENSESCTKEDFDLMMHQIREILEAHGFKLESFGNVDSAIKFYGGIYLERLKGVIDESIKNDLSNLSQTSPDKLYQKVTNIIGETQDIMGDLIVNKKPTLSDMPDGSKRLTVNGRTYKITGLEEEEKK